MKRSWQVGETLKAGALHELGAARAAMIAINRALHPSTPVYRAALRVVEAIDELAQQLTGSRQHFHERPHRTRNVHRKCE